MWAKQSNLTLTFGTTQAITELKWDLQDNLWALISLRTGNDFRSAVIKYNADGTATNLFIIGKQDATGDYSLYYFEVKQLYYTLGMWR